MFHWLKPDGKLKDMSCRVAMLRMHEDGIISLPPPMYKKRPAGKVKPTSDTDQQDPVTCSVDLLPPLRFQIVTQPCSALWNEYIQRYHYLGYTPLPGAQLRYFIYAGEQLVALTGFGAAAWQTAPRDHFIGWDHEQRKRNLHLIVNNARFLILPWIQSKNLASKILSLTSRRLSGDWFERYHTQPVMLETFAITLLLRKKDSRAPAIWRQIGNYAVKPKEEESLIQLGRLVFRLKIFGCILLTRSSDPS